MSHYSKILHKRSSTPGVIPLASTLSEGELAANIADGRLFTKSANNEVFSFSNDQRSAYVLNTNLSGAIPQHGHNTINQVLANVLGGLNNEISGAGSTIVTGEANVIDGDFSFIGSGVNNTILGTGDYSAILGGQNNLVTHSNSFVLGSGLSSHDANFTYVNNISGKFWGDGVQLHNLNATNITSGTLSTARLPAFSGDITTVVGTASATVVALRGNTISTQTPSIGQMLQWSGTAWQPGSVPTGGSGGGGIVYYLNWGVGGTAPYGGLTGTLYQLGRSATVTVPTTGITFQNVTQGSWDTLVSFVTDPADPYIAQLPAGIWDLNFWASSTASTQTQMMLRVQIYAYSDTLSTTTLVATSDTYNIYDPSVVAQYVLSTIVPQTVTTLSSRIYIVLQAQGASPNKNITLYFNADRPTHLHTSVPSVGGSGLVKVINGVFQNPASLLVDVDVASNAEIAQSKISGLTAALDGKLSLTGGTLTGNLSGTSARFSGAVYGSTASAGASSVQLATTAFVHDSIDTGLASGAAVASVVVALVTNGDSVPLVRGNVVYSYGSQGDRVSVRLASSSAESTSSKTLGFVNEDIPINGTGYVTLYGTMDKLDLGSPFVAGDPLWLGTTPGTYTRVKPSAPTHLVYLGVVQRANAGNGTAYIKVQNGYELNEIHDVLITDPLASQILQRNEANTLWTNKDPLFTDNQIVNSSKWNSVYSSTTNISANWNSVYSNVQSNSATYATLSGTQTLTNKTVVDWMTLVRGYNTTPTLNTTIGTGEVWNYVYTSSPSNKTYYRFIATDGSEDAFYASFNGTAVSNLIARKGITI